MGLTEIHANDLLEFRERLVSFLESKGCKVKKTSLASAGQSNGASSSDLLAPSAADVERLMDEMPNPDELFSDREDYVDKDSIFTQWW